MRHVLLSRLALSSASFVLLFSLVSCLPSQDSTSATATRSDSEADRAALAVLDEAWDFTLSQSAFLRMSEGHPVEYLNDPSFEKYQEGTALARKLVADIDGFDKKELTHGRWIELRALRWDLETVIEGERWFWHESVLTSYVSPLPNLSSLLKALPLETQENRREFLDLLGQVPGYIDLIHDHVRGQADRGIYVWRPNHPAAVELIRSMTADLGEPGPYGVASERLEGVEGLEVDFQEQCQALIDSPVRQALTRFGDYVASDVYANKTPQGVGASRLPDGDAYYRFAVRRSTTMAIEPEEIHERGLALVSAMETEMANLRQQVGFEGGRDEFRQHLKTDPQFFPKSPEEVAERLMDAAESMEKVVGEYFNVRPEAPYGVRRLDPALEGSQTYGYYNLPTPSDPKGYYNFNGSKLDERSWLNLRGVSLHELIPGHHFHLARQAENETLSEYRKNMFHGAFTEGWGSYASLLGLEAGVFSGDPYSAYGLYILEVFLATRLVVDTGMNLMEWPLEDGRQFMREHTLESETQITTESLRYSADMPSQALAYQMGKLKLLELRDKASQALGDGFELAEFHEAVLANGSLPMAVLEEHIDWWIEQQR